MTKYVYIRQRSKRDPIQKPAPAMYNPDFYDLRRTGKNNSTHICNKLWNRKMGPAHQR